MYKKKTCKVLQFLAGKNCMLFFIRELQKKGNVPQNIDSVVLTD